MGQSRRKPGGILVQSWHQLWHQLSPHCYLSPGSPLSLFNHCHFLLGSFLNNLHHGTSVFKILCCQAKLSYVPWCSAGKWRCQRRRTVIPRTQVMKLWLTELICHLPLFSPPSSNHSFINEDQQLVQLPYFLIKSWPEGRFKNKKVWE